MSGNEEASGTRARRTVRLDAPGWSALCAVADAYYDGKRHTAADAVLVDALRPPHPIPAGVGDDNFVARVGDLVEACAQRLNQNKRFHYGKDVASAFIHSDGVSVPWVERALVHTPPEPVPLTPWALTVPLALAAEVPANLRAFFDTALVTKSLGLGLAQRPARLPPPTTLPHPESLQHTRHLDEALVALAAAVPKVPASTERVATALRWLRSTLAIRARG